MPKSHTVLITGASAGIGAAIAEEFASHGHDLILVARRKAALESIADKLRAEFDANVIVHAADLLLPNAARNLAKALSGQRVDILVNNAGLLTSGSFKHMDEQSIDNMVHLNIVSLTQMCRTFIPAMVERGHGKVVNIASIAAFQPIPNLAVYAATKAYVLSLSESLSMELARKNVTATAVCPGYTDTDMLRGPMSDGKARIPDIAILAPNKVASDTYQACMDGTPIKIPGIAYNVVMSSVRMMPKWLSRRLTRLGTGIKR